MNLPDLLTSMVDVVVTKLVAIGAVIGVGVGVLRGLIEQKYGSVKAWVGCLAAAVLVGVITHVGLSDITDMSPGMRLVITCVAVFVADDALRGIRALGAMVGADPLGAVRRILDALRGGGTKS